MKKTGGVNTTLPVFFSSSLSPHSGTYFTDNPSVLIRHQSIKYQAGR
ncbi:MAG: hypothetical protein ACLR5I_12040 [Odoribacter splanchnicus]|uniref:Uncharacterized protein n=1 Tax=Odoribacter splanchnicus TaxID=28118 RepID=A0AAW5C7D6_9BACT|nr:hypothetical protein [Odoribacter splanchnicus]MBP7379399.1 hypothetical protein [Odoribacter sp.]MBS6595120.1 hypothetical protein [Odoribacter splanchnicus]MBT9659720.1 hypothetical protein [Odoribacter splanchnicus]MBV4274790.1 hypothetical protein [Odoribacter splanchnicus]MBV4289994.1 hypothetical protein [Odoribacter splanchnicus]